MFSKKVLTLALAFFAGSAFAQPAMGGKGGAGGAGGVTCPTTEQFTGDASYIGQGPKAAPLRGNIGCVDLGPLATRPTERGASANEIFGPMEAGFSSSVPGMTCMGSNTVAGGIDTNLAEAMVRDICEDDSISLLDYCGGHANYHYHERFSCLYSPDSATQHSSRVGTALDGNGIYGHYIDGGKLPTDLDACGGRTGVTPDSNGQEVYYYMITGRAPFTVGCFGPVSSVEQCRSLYSTCDATWGGSPQTSTNVEVVTTKHGTGAYDLDCPCYDEFGSNVPGQGKPGHLHPCGYEPYEGETCETPETPAVTVDSVPATTTTEAPTTTTTTTTSTTTTSTTVPPTTAVPTTSAPTTSTPTTSAPTTDKPTTSAPTTSTPTTSAPTTDKPTTSAPTTSTPTSTTPVTKPPTTPTGRVCCKAMTAECLACAADQTVAEYCKDAPTTMGCPSKPPTGTTTGKPQACCKAMTAECLACAADQTVAEYCKDAPKTIGCGEEGKDREGKNGEGKDREGKDGEGKNGEGKNDEGKDGKMGGDPAARGGKPDGSGSHDTNSERPPRIKESDTQVGQTTCSSSKCHRESPLARAVKDCFQGKDAAFPRPSNHTKGHHGGHHGGNHTGGHHGGSGSESAHGGKGGKGGNPDQGEAGSGSEGGSGNAAAPEHGGKGANPTHGEDGSGSSLPAGDARSCAAEGKRALFPADPARADRELLEGMMDEAAEYLHECLDVAGGAADAAKKAQCEQEARDGFAALGEAGKAKFDWVRNDIFDKVAFDQSGTRTVKLYSPDEVVVDFELDRAGAAAACADLPKLRKAIATAAGDGIETEHVNVVICNNKLVGAEQRRRLRSSAQARELNADGTSAVTATVTTPHPKQTCATMGGEQGVAGLNEALGNVGVAATVVGNSVGAAQNYREVSEADAEAAGATMDGPGGRQDRGEPDANNNNNKPEGGLLPSSWPSWAMPAIIGGGAGLVAIVLVIVAIKCCACRGKAKGGTLPTTAAAVAHGRRPSLKDTPKTNLVEGAPVVLTGPNGQPMHAVMFGGALPKM